MQEMGISSDLFTHLLSGHKTIEARLRTPKFVTLRIGDHISFREDVWKNDRLVSSVAKRATAVITETKFFDDFEELFASVDFIKLLPTAADQTAALQAYKQYYTDKQIAENGVVAISFELT